MPQGANCPQKRRRSQPAPPERPETGQELWQKGRLKLDLANRHGRSSVLCVSATEIIQELPKLSPAERRSVRHVLSDLAAKEEDVQLCNQVATEAAMIFDRMEEEDARRQQG